MFATLTEIWWCHEYFVIYLQKLYKATFTLLSCRSLVV